MPVRPDEVPACRAHSDPDKASYRTQEISAASRASQRTLPPPVIIVTDLDRDGRVEISGRARPGSTVTLTLPDGQTLTAKTVWGGFFSVETSSVTANGSVTAVASASGWQSSSPAQYNYVDRFSPLKPTLTVGDADKDGKVDISGRAEAGSKVTIKMPNGEVVTVVADASGNYSAESTQVQGSGQVTATATDVNGNQSGTATATYTASTTPTPPATPTVVVADADADGRLNVSGVTTAGATVRVTMPDGEVVTTTAGADGSYAVESTAPQTSGNVSVVAVAASGAMSDAAAASWTDTVAPVAPTLVIDDTDGDGRIDVSGSAEAGSTIRVTMPDGSDLVLVADAAGLFVGESLAVQPSGVVQATAVDRAGNVSVAAASTFTAAPPPAVPPTAPVFSITDADADGRPEVTGTTSAGATVTATFAGNQVVSTVADDSGAFALESDTILASGTVSVQASNDAGLSSAVVTGNYVDTTPPQAATVNITHSLSGRLTVSGTAEVGATVKVTFGSGEVITTTAVAPAAAANPSGARIALAAVVEEDPLAGTYTVTSTNYQVPGQPVSVEVTDLNGVSAGAAQLVPYLPTIDVTQGTIYQGPAGSPTEYIVGMRVTTSEGEAGGPPPMFVTFNNNMTPDFCENFSAQWVQAGGYWQMYFLVDWQNPPPTLQYNMVANIYYDPPGNGFDPYGLPFEGFGLLDYQYQWLPRSPVQPSVAVGTSADDAFVAATQDEHPPGLMT